MKENNRNTTISLDEYTNLVQEAKSLRETKGALEANIKNLEHKISELGEKQPEVKVVHYTSEIDTHYDDWRDDVVDEPWMKKSKVEFTNLGDIVTLANEQARVKVEDEVTHLKSTIKSLEQNYDTLSENYNDLQRTRGKEEKKYEEQLADKKEEFEKNILKLKKASDEDTKNYKETIKELKEEIQKVKDSKTDAEIEGKRNEEIINLQTRISDLEDLIGNLRKASFFNRLFKVKTLLQEKDEAEIQVAIRKNAAKKVGTTWVKEGGRVRKFGAFDELYTRLTVKTQDAYNYFYNAFYQNSR